MAGRFSIETVFKGVDRMTSPVRRMQARYGSFADRVAKGTKELDKSFSAFRTKVLGVGKAIALASVVAGGAAVAMGRAGADFEEAITAVGAVGLKSRDQIADLEEKAKELGATTKFTATQSANAMEVMARAGFTSEQILKGVGPVLSAAAASGMEIAEVADHVSNALKGMGLDAGEAGRVADVLALASSRTNSSIGTLGESLRNVSATARDFNIPLEDSVAAVALLQDVGLDASVAGSAFNTMLTKMAKPTKEVAAKMKRFGVTFRDAKGNMLPLQDVLANISKAADKSGGNMDKVAFLADLVGLRGQKAASNLATLFDAGKVQELTKELQNASGAAEKMAVLRMNNLKGDLTLLESAVDGVKVALYETESGPLRGVVQSFTAWVSKNQELITSGFVGFMEGLRDALPAIAYWGKKIAILTAVFLAVGLAVKAATVATALFNAVMAANPITLIALAIVAAIALILAFWPEITAFFAKVWEGIKDIASRIAGAVGEYLKATWEPIKAFLLGVFEFVVGALALVFRREIAAFKMLWGLIKQAAAIVVEAWGPVKAFFIDLWEAISAIAAKVWGGITSVASTVVEQLKQIWEPIKAFFSSLWDSVVSTFTEKFGWVLSKIGGAVNFVRGVGKQVLGGDGPTTAAPQLAPPAAAVSTSAEVTIRDETGRAAVTKKPPRGGGLGLQVAHTGAF